jgi:AcrR family transcriptional regulator
MVLTITDARNPDNRRRLLDGLAESMREKGLAGTQIGDIVRNARTSKRTFYECFPDKESAFVELIREDSAGLLATVEAIVETDAPWQERIERAVDTYLQALSDDPVLVAAISRELPALGQRGTALHREAIDRFAGLFLRASREPWVQDAGIEPVTRDTAVMLVGGIAELIARATTEDRPLTELGPTVKAVILAVASSSSEARASARPRS